MGEQRKGEQIEWRAEVKGEQRRDRREKGEESEGRGERSERSRGEGGKRGEIENVEK